MPICVPRPSRYSTTSRPAISSSPGSLQQQECVQKEDHSEEDRPTVEVALYKRAAAQRASAAAHAKCAWKPRILAWMHQHQEDEDNREEHLQDREDSFHMLRISIWRRDWGQTAGRSAVRRPEHAPDRRSTCDASAFAFVTLPQRALDAYHGYRAFEDLLARLRILYGFMVGCR